MEQDSVKTIRVLVCDDHPVVRDGVRSTLSDLDEIEVVGEAETLDQAVSLAQELEPDIIVMDLKFGDTLSLEVIEAITEEVPTSSILVLSMHNERDYVVRSIKAGAKGYMLKDSPPDDLKVAIGELAKGRAWFDSGVSEHLLFAEEDEDEGEQLLSEREREVLALVADGLSNKEIASKLFLSVRTIEAHRENMMRKLDIHGTAALTKYAIEQGLVSVNIKKTPE